MTSRTFSFVRSNAFKSQKKLPDTVKRFCKFNRFGVITQRDRAVDIGHSDETSQKSVSEPKYIRYNQSAMLKTT